MKQIEQSTNTRISMPKSDDKSDIVKITGNREDAAVAKKELKAISDDLVIERLLIIMQVHIV